jgi:hypothetical protein
MQSVLDRPLVQLNVVAQRAKNCGHWTWRHRQLYRVARVHRNISLFAQLVKNILPRSSVHVRCSSGVLGRFVTPHSCSFRAEWFGVYDPVATHDVTGSTADETWCERVWCPLRVHRIYGTINVTRTAPREAIRIVAPCYRCNAIPAAARAIAEDDTMKLVFRVGGSVHLAPECVPDVQNRGRDYPFSLTVCRVRVVALKLECKNLWALVGSVCPTSRPLGTTTRSLALSAHTRFDVVVQCLAHDPPDVIGTELVLCKTARDSYWENMSSVIGEGIELNWD